MPIIIESFDPERIVLSLAIGVSGSKKVAIKNGDKKVTIKTIAHKEAIIEYLTVHVSAKSADFAEILALKPSRIRSILNQMVKDEIIVTEGNNRNRIYKLKA